MFTEKGSAGHKALATDMQRLQILLESWSGVK
jgi:hypothetical protein